MQIKVYIFGKNMDKGENMHEIDLKKYNVRTDLVVDILKETDKTGVTVEERETSSIKVSNIQLEKENALGKKEGRYITISFQDVTDHGNRKKVEEVFASELEKLLELHHLTKKKCLVVGLGNSQSTPDSLGPKVAGGILVTRYLFEMEKVQVEENFSNVASITPGVSGTTGIESSDILHGIIHQIHPDYVIAIDALASSSIDRMNRTIQMTDTGIHPGSGVGNKRKEISEETVHIPVIAIGIPTVIDGVTIVSDTIQYMLQQFSYHKENIGKSSWKLAPVTNQNYLNQEKELTQEEKEQLLGMVGGLSEEEMKSLIFEVLTPIGYNLMVTVKEMDFITEKLASVLIHGINRVLHGKDFSE